MSLDVRQKNIHKRLAIFGFLGFLLLLLPIMFVSGFTIGLKGLIHFFKMFEGAQSTLKYAIPDDALFICVISFSLSFLLIFVYALLSVSFFHRRRYPVLITGAIAIICQIYLSVIGAPIFESARMKFERVPIFGYLVFSLLSIALIATMMCLSHRNVSSHTLT